MNKSKSFILLFALIVFCIPLTLWANSKITGRVIDRGTKSALPGASVYLLKTNLGCATDLNGNYSITDVPAGTYTLRVSYIGYKTQTIKITVSTTNETLHRNFSLEVLNIEGKQVVVTAQAEGQMQAINQQISSNSIVNVVSSAKIKELPESNAAEAVGRLPGISLVREGGEGSEVVIRGLAPQYNLIQINGVTLPSTGNYDRSVDLVGISPYNLQGIEVSKAAMADQEANQIGGSVNFILKGAPKNPILSLTAQGGYNELRNQANNYYYVASFGKRFFNDKFGVLFQGDLEKTDRSSNSATADFSTPQAGQNNAIFAQDLTVPDTRRTNERQGGVLVLDYSLPSTKIKLCNTINNINIEQYTAQENFSPMPSAGETHNYQAVYSKGSLLQILNTLDVEQNIGDIKIDANINYAESKNNVPNIITMNATEAGAFAQNWQWNQIQMPASNIPQYAVNNISNTYINALTGGDSVSTGEQTSGNLSIEDDFKSDLVDIHVKIGGEYKHTYKKFDYNEYEEPLSWGDLALARLALAQRYGVPLATYSYSNTSFPYGPFIDPNYNAGDFKAGANYTISRVPDQNMVLDCYNFIYNLKTVNGQPTNKTAYWCYTYSNENDYSGHENYAAAYIMPTITFGDNLFTLIPGVRYEYNMTEYTTNRSNGPGKETDPYIYFAYTSSRVNNYVLPMIQLKYSPLDWLDVRASYTETLARPDFQYLIPSWTTYGSSINVNNISLRPARSQNFDLNFSFHSQKIGLFSVGVFEKQIKDFVMATTTYIANSSQIDPSWPSTVALGGTINTFINNPSIAKVGGLETEWQSNFWFLPGVLRGLVLDINYTYTSSRMKYPSFAPIFQYEKVGPVLVKKLVGTADNGYYQRMLLQPTDILNVELGFDYKGFSIRGALQYTSDVFQSSNFYQQDQQITSPLSLWNLKVRQELPVKGLLVFMNLNNISKAVDQTINNGTGWFTNRQYYGLTLDLGLTYNIL